MDEDLLNFKNAVNRSETLSPNQSQKIDFNKEKTLDYKNLKLPKKNTSIKSENLEDDSLRFELNQIPNKKGLNELEKSLKGGNAASKTDSPVLKRQKTENPSKGQTKSQDQPQVNSKLQNANNKETEYMDETLAYMDRDIKKKEKAPKENNNLAMKKMKSLKTIKNDEYTKQQIEKMPIRGTKSIGKVKNEPESVAVAVPVTAKQKSNLKIVSQNKK
jgi:hypothetical protein